MRSGFLGGGIGPMALKRRAVAVASTWWEVAGQTCVAAYKAIGAASLTASYTNLANPGVNNAAPGVAPTLVAGGWSFNGLTQYLATGIVPANGWSMLIRVSASSGTSICAIGAVTGSVRFHLFPRNSGTMAYGYGDNANVGTQITAGAMAICGGDAYLDGISLAALGGSLTGISHPLFIGTRNNNGSTDAHFSGVIAAVAIYKPTEPSTTPMSAADVAALTTRMQALA